MEIYSQYNIINLILGLSFPLFDIKLLKTEQALVCCSNEDNEWIYYTGLDPLVVKKSKTKQNVPGILPL